MAGPVPAAALVHDGQALVAGHRRPRGRVQARAPGRPTGRRPSRPCGPHDPQREVHAVPVLGVLDRQQRLVAGQAGHRRRSRRGGGCSGPGRRPPRRRRRSPRPCRCRRRRPSRRSAMPVVQASGTPGRNGSGDRAVVVRAVERPDHPAGRLVARRVVEPDDALSVRRRQVRDRLRRRQDPDRVVGHAAAVARGAVPGVDLPRPALVRGRRPAGRARAAPRRAGRGRARGSAAPRRADGVGSDTAAILSDRRANGCRGSRREVRLGLSPGSGGVRPGRRRRRVGGRVRRRRRGPGSGRRGG